MSRRFVLGGGAAVAIGLPLFEAMMPARRAAALAEPAPRRLVVFYVPNGIHMPSWTPQAVGPGFDLPPILQPLAGLEPDLLVLSGLANLPAQPEGPGDHAGGTSAFITATHVTKSESVITNGTSIDQMYADHLGAATPLSSLQLGIEGGDNVGGCDSGYGCAYSRNISWRGNVPVPKLTSPAAAFDLLFAGFDPTATAAELARRKANRLSVLDHAIGEASALQGRLGATDRVKLDEYLDSVRDLELRVQAESTMPQCELPPAPGDPADLPGHIRLMLDVIVKALECDRTRAITFMLGNAGSNHDYGFLGAGGGHHNISHHGGDPANYAKLEVIDRFEIEQLAYLLGAMKATTDGEGTLLDHSMVFFSSEIEDGNTHAHANLPVILAGRGGDTLTPGRHLVYDGEPIANLFVAMLQRLGVATDTFGDDGSGPLDGLS